MDIVEYLEQHTTDWEYNGQSVCTRSISNNKSITITKDRVSFGTFTVHLNNGSQIGVIEIYTLDLFEKILMNIFKNETLLYRNRFSKACETIFKNTKEASYVKNDEWLNEFFKGETKDEKESN